MIQNGKRIFLIVAACWFLGAVDLWANNVTVSNVETSERNVQEDSMVIQFDLSLENSWRDGINYDAAWVFAKFSTDFGATWRHVTLSLSGKNPSGFSVGTGTAIELLVPADKKGVFIQRSGSGVGTVNTTQIKIVWDYGVDGVSDYASYQVLLKVFAIEMVYVPQGYFYAGDSTASDSDPAGGFYNASSADEQALSLSGEGELTLGGSSSGNLRSRSGMEVSDDFGAGSTVSLAQTFPKGYDAVYAMKYELSQGFYVEFLNTLTRSAQARRVAADISADGIVNVYVMANTAAKSAAYRNEIQAPSSGNGTTEPVVFSTTRPYRAANFLSWMDGCAFADWAALRPMTELEFEKIARGSGSVAVSHEYAWGEAEAVAATQCSTSIEDGSETIVTENANAHYGAGSLTGCDSGASTKGPLRIGIFARSYSNRDLAGAGYYGNMELSGNVWERTVTVGNVQGRSFAGTHGDGLLTTAAGYEGNATNWDWPGIDGTRERGVTGASGSGFRGGADDEVLARLYLSDRYWAAKTDTTRGLSGRQYGFRAVRDGA